MADTNIILIKRRISGSTGAPASLSGGELAYNEVDNILYYGANNGTRMIAGSGNYVDISNAQTISGSKTFTGSTTLSSVTLTGVLNAGNYTISNVADPASNQDVVTRKYADDNFLKISEGASGYLPLSGGIVTGSLTINENLTVLGGTTQLDTIIQTTSALSVTNDGTGPALIVTQTGANDIVTFKDDETIALIIKDGGNVGINTTAPNQRLSVSGNISASSFIYAQKVNLSSDLEGLVGVSNIGGFVIDGGSF